MKKVKLFFVIILLSVTTLSSVQIFAGSAEPDCKYNPGWWYNALCVTHIKTPAQWQAACCRQPNVCDLPC